MNRQTVAVVLEVLFLALALVGVWALIGWPMALIVGGASGVVAVEVKA